MQRPSLVSGTSVALELLPKLLATPPTGCPVVEVLGRTAPPADITAARAAFGRMTLSCGEQAVPLAGIAALADLSAPFTAPQGPEPGVADLAAGRVPEALGHLLFALFRADRADPSTLYSMALCLAALNHGAEAYRLITLLDGSDDPGPVLLALRGYLAFQNGEADLGRKALARAALAARGVPEYRPILHFTQHVLLVQQFGG